MPGALRDATTRAALRWTTGQAVLAAAATESVAALTEGVLKAMFLTKLKMAVVVLVAGLVVTGQPGTLQIRLVDPLTQGVRDGLGACTGDSGGPVFEDQPAGAVIVGVISWSTGPNGSAGCGGLTGVTPLTLYRDWILQTARAWGSAL